MSDEATETPPPAPEPKRIRISNQAFIVFQDMFLDWVDANITDLEFGNPGDVKSLAVLCARWATDHLKD